MRGKAFLGAEYRLGSCHNEAYKTDAEDQCCQAAFASMMRDTGMGVAVTRGLLSALCGAMPSWMMEDLVKTVQALFDALLPAAVSGWVEAVVQDPTFER